MKLSVIKFAVLYSVAATLLYIALLLTFLGLKKADKVSPGFAIVFFYAGTALIQTIPIAIAVAAAIKTCKSLLDNKSALATVILVTIVVVVFAYICSYFASVWLFQIIINNCSDIPGM